MVEVKLLGELGKRFGRSYRFAADSPREVISALSNQLQGFKEYFVNAHENGIGFKLIDEDPEGMMYENVLMPCRRLIIAPVISGSGSAGRILLGVALVALAFIPGVGWAAATAATATKAATAAGFTLLGSISFQLGISLVLTGIASLISPKVQTPTSETERKESYLFDRAAESTVQGQPVPVLYGRFWAGSPLVISSAITTQQVPV